MTLRKPDPNRRSWEEFDRLTAERERAYQRLIHLFKISKLLSDFESTEKSLPTIVAEASKTLPLWTAVLIETRAGQSRTTILHAPELSDLRLKEAVTQARALHGELLGLNPSQISEMESAAPVVFPFQFPSRFPVPEVADRNRHILLPLIVCNLPPFGTFQVECQVLPDEVDLGFVGSLANLIAVALDRHRIAQDEEERRKRETAARRSELDQTQGQVSDLEKERDLRNRFIATLTHDLRTPLTTARLCSELILKESDNPDQCRAYARRTRASVDRMDTMIQDLLDMARIRSGERLPLKIQECSLPDIAGTCLAELAAQYGDRFLLDTGEADPSGIRGYWSADLLRRMIENLVNNAVKYGLPDRPIRVSLRQNQDKVMISVHNEGNPLSPEDQAGIFEPFSRTHSANASTKKGWGLGLTLVKGTAEAHGGSVRVESAPRQGTDFIVTLPRDSRPFAR